MEKMTRATEAAPNTSAKVHKKKDITKLIEYLMVYDATTLDAQFGTGILRNSICYYIRSMEKMGIVQAIFRKPDRHTHHMAKHYSCNPDKWNQQVGMKELSLFNEEEF